MEINTTKFITLRLRANEESKAQRIIVKLEKQGFTLESPMQPAFDDFLECQLMKSKTVER